MTLECTSCHARYSIADSLIPAQGARIKCRKCGEVFAIEPPVIELAPSDLEVIPPPPRQEPPAVPPAVPVPAEPSSAPASFELEAPVGSPAPVGLPAPAASPAHVAQTASEMPAPDPGFERFGEATRFAAPPPFADLESPAAGSVPAFDAAPSFGAASVPDAQPVAEAAPVGAPAFEPEPSSGPATSTLPPLPTALEPVAQPPSGSAGGTPIPEGLGSEERARHEKARRLARVLASDIAIYNREKRDRGIKDGNLVAVLGYEIKKSWEIYKERVTPEFANSTPYFRDALNEMLAEGKKIF